MQYKSFRFKKTDGKFFVCLDLRCPCVDLPYNKKNYFIKMQVELKTKHESCGDQYTLKATRWNHPFIFDKLSINKTSRAF